MAESHEPRRAWQIPRRAFQKGPSDGIALCLSGGGYRAMLFHVGTLWRLNEIGYLNQLRCVCSVSGGSITAAVLGLHWDDLQFDRKGTAVNFEEEIVTPLRGLADRTLDVPAVLTGMVPGVTVGGRLAAAYRRHLFGDATLRDLPRVGRAPEFVIKATNLQSGVLWRFSREYAADYKVGEIPRPEIPLATAVAASSAFPPLLGPVRLRLSEDDYKPNSGSGLQEPPFTTRPTLADGGVYDNLGQEVAWKRCRTVLLSDGGGAAQPDGGGLGPFPDWRWRDWGSQYVRVLKTIDNQVRSLRKRRAIAGFKATAGSDEHRHGAYWGIRSDILHYLSDSDLPAPFEATTALAAVPTRLKRLDSGTQERLINWGYAICDAAVRRWVDDSLSAPRGFPYPGSPLA
ncbi:MAG TPA: patatin-like phospholipase family protein [Solirubrobacterales bacterium]